MEVLVRGVIVESCHALLILLTTVCKRTKIISLCMPNKELEILLYFLIIAYLFYFRYKVIASNDMQRQSTMLSQF